jgi:7 transmembrane receptor (rhodopsin family)
MYIFQPLASYIYVVYPLIGKWIGKRLGHQSPTKTNTHARTEPCLTVFSFIFHRYYAIVKPLKYPINMTKRVVAIMILITWLAPALLSFVPIFAGNYYHSDYTIIIVVVFVAVVIQLKMLGQEAKSEAQIKQS